MISHGRSIRSYISDLRIVSYGTCMVDGAMDVTIEKPNKTELNNADILTCHSTGLPVPSTRWEIVDGERTVWDLGTGPQLTVGQMCLYRQWMWDLRSSSTTVRCTATRLNYTASSDVNITLSNSDSDKIVCGMCLPNIQSLH